MRALLVGCGSHGGDVLLPAALAAGIRPVGLVDTDLVRANTLADRWGIESTYTSVEEATTLNLDAVMVALPLTHHASHITWAIKRHLHVFVEKPPTTDLTQLRVLVDQLRAAELVCHVGMNFRCAAGVQELARRLDSGRHGSPSYVRVVQVARRPVKPFHPGMSMEASLFYAQGIHAIDLALSFAPAATTISGQLMPVKVGRLCVVVGEDVNSGARIEASFGSNAASLYHELDIFCDSGDLLSLRNLSELLYLPGGGQRDIVDYPGGRVLWRRSPTNVGYEAAGYVQELSSFKAHVAGEPDPSAGRAAQLSDLLSTYDAFDQLMISRGVSWTI